MYNVIIDLPKPESIIGKDGDFKGFYQYIPDEYVDEETKDFIVWKWLLYIIRHEGNDE